MNKPDYKEQAYVLKIDEDISESARQFLLTKVDINKRSRIQKFYRREDAVRCLFADLLIRYILIKNYSVVNQNLHFIYSAYGKPSFASLPDFHFNISHSGQWIVCAVSNKPVGIDIEAIAPIDLDIADAYFSVKEKKILFSLPPAQQTDFFFQLWTLKESYIKMEGKGLSMPLDAFSVFADNSGRHLLEREGIIDTQVFFTQYEVDNQYKLAVCSHSSAAANLIRVYLKDIITFFTNQS